MNSFDVEVTRNEIAYKATAKVEGGMLTVSALNFSVIKQRIFS